MGITATSLERINRHIKPIDKLLIIGCQNLYNPDNYGEIAAKYFRELGHTVRDIDIYECNGCQIADLREDWQASADFDMVLQHGTIEHIDCDLYQALKNLHESCVVGGIMIHENPKTGNWPGHGQHYFTKEFWSVLSEACGYDVLELTQEPAMGNDLDGWNVSCVLRKSEQEFISEELFNQIYNKHIFKS